MLPRVALYVNIIVSTWIWGCSGWWHMLRLLVGPGFKDARSGIIYHDYLFGPGFRDARSGIIYHDYWLDLDFWDAQGGIMSCLFFGLKYLANWNSQLYF